MRRCERLSPNRFAPSSRPFVRHSSACRRSCVATSMSAASCSRAGSRFYESSTNTCSKGTGLPVVKAGEPLATVVIGAGRLLSDRALLSKVAVN